MNLPSKRMGSLYIFILLVLLTAGSGAHAARNVILMIGDGMGPEHIKAGSYFLYGEAGKLCFEPLYKCTVATCSANSLITDSAAAASAMATGHKVNNDVISQAPDGTPYETVLEKARTMGKRTGLVTTKFITDATPGGFGAHDISRVNYLSIADDYVHSSQPEVLFGAGDPSYGGQYFSSTQLAYAQSLGYRVAVNYAQMSALVPSTTERALGLFNNFALPYEVDRTASSTEPHLSQMAVKALDILNMDSDGFFVMIEGGLIDNASHENKTQRMVGEVVEFNNTIQAVLNWMAGRNDTLLIVTADHETGGPTVTNMGAGVYPTITWSTTGHTGNNVPLFATGSDSALVDTYIKSGAIDNTDIYRIMSTALTPAEPTLSGAKGLADGRSVQLSGHLFTAGSSQLNSTIYLEDSDRLSGLKVSGVTQTINEGDKVDVSGLMNTINGERIVTGASITVYPGPNVLPEPLYMRVRDLGGAALNTYTPGVTDGTGINNIGLLVRTIGRVIDRNDSRSLFFLDDGGVVQVNCGDLAMGNGISMPRIGSFVAVTGICTTAVDGSIVAASVRPRKQGDITVYRP